MDGWTGAKETLAPHPPHAAPWMDGWLLSAWWPSTPATGWSTVCHHHHHHHGASCYLRVSRPSDGGGCVEAMMSTLLLFSPSICLNPIK